MVAQVFPKGNITDYEIRVSWCDVTTGYVSGHKFEIRNTIVCFDNETPDNAKNLRTAVERCPEYGDAKREGTAKNMIVQNGNFPGVYQVTNPLNGNIYNVVMHPNKTFCECPDHQYRGVECKHLRAVQHHIERQQQPLMTGYAGKAFSSGRIKSNPNFDISDEQYLAISRASLGI
jgi:hypothetical protein